MNPNDQNQQPGLPQSDQSSTPIIPQPTTGNEHIPTAKRWMPRLIISAIIINLLPTLFSLFNESYIELSATIRTCANGILIIGFIIVTLKILSENKNA